MDAEHSHDGTITAADLDHERLRSYLEWGEVELPHWWFMAYGASIALWTASYELGPGWGTFAAIAFAFVMGFLIRVATARTGVSTPRFRSMPAALRRTFLLPGAVALACLVIGTSVVQNVDDPPYALIGVVVGPVIALAAGFQGRWYRSVARRIAVEQGIQL